METKEKSPKNPVFGLKGYSIDSNIPMIHVKMPKIAISKDFEKKWVNPINDRNNEPNFVLPRLDSPKKFQSSSPKGKIFDRKIIDIHKRFANQNDRLKKRLRSVIQNKSSKVEKEFDEIMKTAKTQISDYNSIKIDTKYKERRREVVKEIY